MGRGALSEPSQFSYDMGDRTLQPLWEDLLKEFSASDCPFFALDTREAAKDTSLFGADKMVGAGSATATGFKSGLLGTDTTNPFADDKVTGIDTLRSLSKRTGGKYYSNIGSYEKNLAAVGDLTGAFYVLGYYPASTEDGKFHRIKVEVKRKGARVMAPSGFYDPKPFTAYTKLEKDLHLFDLALNERAVSRLPLGLPVTALTSGTADGPGLRVLARVPGEITARFTGEKIEYVAIVFDDKGDIRDIRRGEADARERPGPGRRLRGFGRARSGRLHLPRRRQGHGHGPERRGLDEGRHPGPCSPGPAALDAAPSGRGDRDRPGRSRGREENQSAAVGRDLRLRPDPFLARGREVSEADPTAPGRSSPTRFQAPPRPDLVLSARLIDAANGQAIPSIPILVGKSAHPVAILHDSWSSRSPGSRPAPTTSISTPRTGSPRPWPGPGRR